MNPSKVRRHRVTRLTDLPNIGSAMAGDLLLLGIRSPNQLVGLDPLKLYQSLCRKTGVRQDPCVLDTFISVIRFMDGDVPRPWWAYSEERKQLYGSIITNVGGSSSMTAHKPLQPTPLRGPAAEQQR